MNLTVLESFLACESCTNDMVSLGYCMLRIFIFLGSHGLAVAWSPWLSSNSVFLRVLDTWGSERAGLVLQLRPCRCCLQHAPRRKWRGHPQWRSGPGLAGTALARHVAGRKSKEGPLSGGPGAGGAGAAGGGGGQSHLQPRRFGPRAGCRRPSCCGFSLSERRQCAVATGLLPLRPP